MAVLPSPVGTGRQRIGSDRRVIATRSIAFQSIGPGRGVVETSGVVQESDKPRSCVAAAVSICEKSITPDRGIIEARGQGKEGILAQSCIVGT